MAKVCPLTGSFKLYYDCLECDVRRECRRKVLQVWKKYEQVVIGVDQSYKRTGISIAADGKLVHVCSVDLSESNDKTWKRHEVQKHVEKACFLALNKSKKKPVLVLERIRMFSQQFVSIPYIKQMGALNAYVIDKAWSMGIETYSIDTRAWKAGVLGTSKPADNDFGVPPEKWPCVGWVIRSGFEEAVKLSVSGRRQKGTFTDENGKKWEYDNDACDSAGMAMSWFCCDPSKFEREF